MDASTRSAKAAGDSADHALELRNLSKEYRAGVAVLKNISLKFAGRGIAAIIGPSGTGKSTLIRCINRLTDPTAGEILFMGTDLAKLSGRRLREARRKIGMVFQEYNLVERLSVIENVLCGRLGYVPAWRAWLRRFPAKDIERAFSLLDSVGLGDFATERADRLSGGQRQRVGIARAFSLLDAVGLGDFASERADQLSGGQRQRVGIARALMQDPDLVLADEPTSSLDPKTSVEIMELIAGQAGAQGIPVIVNIHNVELAKRYADRVIGMSKGEVVFDGPPKALEHSHLKQIYGGEGWLE
jgi:phosphonate transport system ATP-binding protein